MTKPKLKTAEQVIQEKAERESDFQLRKNIESGIVFTLTPELLEIVEIYRGDELKRQLKKVLDIPYDLMGISKEPVVGDYPSAPGDFICTNDGKCKKVR